MAACATTSVAWWTRSADRWTEPTPCPTEPARCSTEPAQRWTRSAAIGRILAGYLTERIVCWTERVVCWTECVVCWTERVVCCTEPAVSPTETALGPTTPIFLATIPTRGVSIETGGKWCAVRRLGAQKGPGHQCTARRAELVRNDHDRHGEGRRPGNRVRGVNAAPIHRPSTLANASSVSCSEGGCITLRAANSRALGYLVARIRLAASARS